MNKLERMAIEIGRATSKPDNESGREWRIEYGVNCIRKGIELCREMMRNGPHGVVIWEYDIVQLLDYLDGEAITKDDALRSINNAMKFELEKQAMRKEEAEE